jgi:hypothetical protein
MVQKIFVIFSHLRKNYTFATNLKMLIALARATLKLLAEKNIIFCFNQFW